MRRRRRFNREEYFMFHIITSFQFYPYFLLPAVGTYYYLPSHRSQHISSSHTLNWLKQSCLDLAWSNQSKETNEHWMCKIFGELHHNSWIMRSIINFQCFSNISPQHTIFIHLATIIQMETRFSKCWKLNISCLVQFCDEWWCQDGWPPDMVWVFSTPPWDGWSPCSGHARAREMRSQPPHKPSTNNLLRCSLHKTENCHWTFFHRFYFISNEDRKAVKLFNFQFLLASIKAPVLAQKCSNWVAGIY